MTLRSTDDLGIEPVTDWRALARRDETLRRYVNAEVARAEVDASAWRCEAEHWRRVAGDLRERLDAAQTSGDRERRGARERQVAHRRRTQFVAPMTEGVG